MRANADWTTAAIAALALGAVMVGHSPLRLLLAACDVALIAWAFTKGPPGGPPRAPTG